MPLYLVTTYLTLNKDQLQLTRFLRILNVISNQTTKKYPLKKPHQISSTLMQLQGNIPIYFLHYSEMSHQL